MGFVPLIAGTVKLESFKDLELTLRKNDIKIEDNLIISLKSPENSFFKRRKFSKGKISNAFKKLIEIKYPNIECRLSYERKKGVYWKDLLIILKRIEKVNLLKLAATVPTFPRNRFLFRALLWDKVNKLEISNLFVRIPNLLKILCKTISLKEVILDNRSASIFSSISSFDSLPFNLKVFVSRYHDLKYISLLKEQVINMIEGIYYPSSSSLTNGMKPVILLALPKLQKYEIFSFYEPSNRATLKPKFLVAETFLNRFERMAYTVLSS